jgi:hypothetical protein
MQSNSRAGLPLRTDIRIWQISRGEGQYVQYRYGTGIGTSQCTRTVFGLGCIYANIPTGTIFGIFQTAECGAFHANDEIFKDDQQTSENTLQPGRNLVAAGYCLYSSATRTLVITLECGVQGFTLAETIGEFRLTHPNIVIPLRSHV